MKKILSLFLAAAMAVSLLTSCGNRSSGEKESPYYLYYLDEDGDGLYQREYTPVANSANDMIKEFISELQSVPSKAKYSPLLETDVRIQAESLKSGMLTLDFSSEYSAMDATREVLARAGIVRSLIQIDGVDEVKFEVDGRAAKTPDGEEIGVMNENTFVDNAAKQINTIQHTQIDLYFATEDGTQLQKESRSIYYSASKPLEWAVVERLIAGPKVSGNYATLPANTQILSVTSADGICYVNLDSTFTTDALAVDEKIPVYSIVDTIVKDCSNISQVQISVNGESDIMFRGSMDLSKPYETDFSLVKDATSSDG